VGGPDHRTGAATDHTRDHASITHSPIFRERARLHVDTPRMTGISRTLAGGVGRLRRTVANLAAC